MEQPKEKSYKAGLIGQLTAYTAGASVGLVTIWATIRENFYRNMKKIGFFDKARDAAIEKHQSSKASGAEFVKETVKIRNDYSKEVSDITSKMGFTNSFQKFQLLTKFQKVKVLGFAATACTVAVGAISHINQNKKISHQLHEINRKLDASAAAGIS